MLGAGIEVFISCCEHLMVEGFPLRLFPLCRKLIFPPRSSRGKLPYQRKDLACWWLLRTVAYPTALHIHDSVYLGANAALILVFHFFPIQSSKTFLQMKPVTSNLSTRWHITPAIPGSHICDGWKHIFPSCIRKTSLTLQLDNLVPLIFLNGASIWEIIAQDSSES